MICGRSSFLLPPVGLIILSAIPAVSFCGRLTYYCNWAHRSCSVISRSCNSGETLSSQYWSISLTL